MAVSEKDKRRFGPQVKRPDGVPKVAWPPHAGALRQWNRRTRRLVEIIEWKFDVTCSTYEWHGNNKGNGPETNGSGNGKRNAFDAWVAQPGTAATPVQEDYGDRIQNFIEENFNVWFYQIWWNWMRYYYGQWFSYEPYWREYIKQSQPQRQPPPQPRTHPDQEGQDSTSPDCTSHKDRLGRG
jgi:hypothetical protein